MPFLDQTGVENFASNIKTLADARYELISNVASKGSTKLPIYFDAGGIAHPTSYTIEKSIPANAVFSFSSFTGAPTSNQTPGFGQSFTLPQVNQTTAGAITTTARTVTIPNDLASTAGRGLVPHTYDIYTSPQVTFLGASTIDGDAQWQQAGNHLASTAYAGFMSSSDKVTINHLQGTDSGTDLNNLMQFGYYRYSASSVIHAPTTNAGGHVLVLGIGSASNYVWQVAFVQNSATATVNGLVYMRKKSANGWSNWHKVTLTAS